MPARLRIYKHEQSINGFSPEYNAGQSSADFRSVKKLHGN